MFEMLFFAGILSISLFVIPSLSREIKIYNKCPFTTWAGILGPGNPEGGGFRLNAGEARSIYVDDGWKSARIWPRTDCDGNMNCATGNCGVNIGNSEIFKIHRCKNMFIFSINSIFFSKMLRNID